MIQKHSLSTDVQSMRNTSGHTWKTYYNRKRSTITFPVFVQFVYTGLSGVPSLTETYRNFEAFLSVFLVLVKGDKLSLYGFVGNCNESNTFLWGTLCDILYVCVFL